MATVIGSRREARLRYLLFMRTLPWRRHLLPLNCTAMMLMDQYDNRVYIHTLVYLTNLLSTQSDCYYSSFVEHVIVLYPECFPTKQKREKCCVFVVFLCHYQKVFSFTSLLGDVHMQGCLWWRESQRLHKPHCHWCQDQ